MNNLFYSLEDGKYYTYPDGDEATGIQIREVIEANERSISKLQQETEKLKKQYCERTDCCGRIGNSKKVEELQNENKQLKDNWNELKEYTQEKYDNPSWASCGARYVLEKMQELEQGKDE